MAYGKPYAKIQQDRHEKSEKSPADDANADAKKQLRSMNELVTSFLSLVEIPVFGSAVFALLIFSERSFWSPQVRYQTEPIATIGT
jgi:hypothetical protein